MIVRRGYNFRANLAAYILIGVVVAFLIASHVSAALNHSPAPAQVAANNPAN